MKLLVAIKSCHAYGERRRAQRETWVQTLQERLWSRGEGQGCGEPGSAPENAFPTLPRASEVTVRFFLGRPLPAAARALPDEVVLDVPDAYAGLSEKVQAICRWARGHSCDRVLLCDDDVYVSPERLLAGWGTAEYAGRLRGPDGGFRAPYASGFAVWLGAQALAALEAAPPPADRRDDRWMGNCLLEAGIPCQDDPRLVVCRSRRQVVNFPEGPRAGNEVLAAAEFSPPELRREHAEQGAPARVPPAPPRAGPFAGCTVHLDPLPAADLDLVRVVVMLEERLPGVRLALVDDRQESRRKISFYSELRRRGHLCLWLPLGAGAAARAAAVEATVNGGGRLVRAERFSHALAAQLRPVLVR